MSQQRLVNSLKCIVHVTSDLVTEYAGYRQTAMAYVVSQKCNLLKPLRAMIKTIRHTVKFNGKTFTVAEVPLIVFLFLCNFFPGVDVCISISSSACF